MKIHPRTLWSIAARAAWVGAAVWTAGSARAAEGPPAPPAEAAPRVAQAPGFPGPSYPSSSYSTPAGPAFSGGYVPNGFNPGPSPTGESLVGGGVSSIPFAAQPAPAAQPAVGGPVGFAAVPSASEESATRALAVLREIMAIPNGSIPTSLLTSAEAVAIIPNVIKVGFVAGVRHGRGVVLIKQADGTWSLPQFVVITGGSLGWQIGAQATDVVLVFRTPASVQGLMRGKFTIGADAAVAAGPVGRQAQAATDLELRAEILSYSRSRGLFAGVALDGASLRMDPRAQEEFYGRGPDGRPARIPASAEQLMAFLGQFTRPAAGAAAAGAGTAAGSGAAGAAPTAFSPSAQALVDAGARLGPLLDPQWKAFLELPPELLRPSTGVARGPSIESLQASLQRYRTVAEDPKFRELNQRPEFRATFDALQRLVQEMQAAAPASSLLNLPPPPGGAR